MREHAETLCESPRHPFTRVPARGRSLLPEGYARARDIGAGGVQGRGQARQESGDV